MTRRDDKDTFPSCDPFVRLHNFHNCFAQMELQAPDQQRCSAAVASLLSPTLHSDSASESLRKTRLSLNVYFIALSFEHTIEYVYRY